MKGLEDMDDRSFSTSIFKEIWLVLQWGQRPRSWVKPTNIVRWTAFSMQYIVGVMIVNLLAFFM